MTYLAIVVLLPFGILGGSSGSALASGGPAAKYIGADAYSTPTWTIADTPSIGEPPAVNPNYLGNLQSEKFFYNNEPMPGSDAAKTSDPSHSPGCGAMSGGTYVYPTSILCIITWDTATANDGSDLKAFLNSTVTDPHQIVMAFCNEPEIHHGSSGCMCDPSGTVKPCLNSAAFTTQFEAEYKYITNFEQAKGMTNVKVAEDSWTDYYNGSPPNCSFIVPPQDVNYYLVDVYEPNPTGQNLSHNAGWNGWVNCTTFPGSGDARGIAEYGIGCGNEHSDQMSVADTFAADDTYLKTPGLFPNLLVWNIWDSGGCTIDSAIGDELDSVAAWQSIEAGN